MLEYRLCCLICAESDKYKILLIADVSFAELFSVVNNDISIPNQKIIFDQ